MLKMIMTGMVAGVAFLATVAGGGMVAMNYGASAFEEAMEREFPAPVAQTLEDDDGDHNAPNEEDVSDCVEYLVGTDHIPRLVAEIDCRKK